MNADYWHDLVNSYADLIEAKYTRKNMDSNKPKTGFQPDGSFILDDSFKDSVYKIPTKPNPDPLVPMKTKTDQPKESNN
jgi:hypothetical protein